MPLCFRNHNVNPPTGQADSVPFNAQHQGVSLADQPVLLCAGQHADDLPLHLVLQRAGPEAHVIGLGQPELQTEVPGEGNVVPLLGLLLPHGQLPGHQLDALRRREGEEAQDLAHPPQELVLREGLFQLGHDRLLDELHVESVRGDKHTDVVGDFLVGQIRCQYEGGLAAVDCLTPAIGEPPLVKRLQQHLQYIWVGLLHLIQEHDRPWVFQKLICQLPSFFVSFVPWWGPYKLRHLVLLLVLRHVQADEALTQPVRHTLGQAGLPCP
mmetsp:Transcript_16288/g.28920  ORF Transcript_16288/g.28920 Transcript_16288/m.28920 type:complete len:268 (+) Transcript_16288:1040-1843(+)